ncbi:MAG: HAMP domain-containing sensor histidine kinase [bacterium]
MLDSLASFFIKDSYCYTQLVVNQVYAPVQLILYSHIPTAIVTILVGIFILSKDRSLEAKIFFFLSLVFFVFTLGDLVEWFVFLGRGPVVFARSVIEIADLLLFLFSSYFLFVLIKKRDARLIYKIIWLLPVLSFAGVLMYSVSHNLTSYNWNICEVVEDSLIGDYGYYMDLFYFVTIIIFATWSIINGKEDRGRIALASISVCSFISLFFAMEYVFTGYIFGDAFDYSYFVYAFFGMPVLIGVLAYMVVRYKVFNFKLIGAQALVIGIFALIASQFAFIQNDVNRILTAITLVLVTIFGWQLIKSVKKEIEQKEELIKGAIALRESNERELEKARSVAKLKDEFVFVATHELRTPVTAIKGFLELVKEEDVQFPPAVKKDLDAIAMASGHLSELVNNLLEIARSEAGTMKIETRPIKIVDVVKGVLAEIESLVLEKNIKLNTDSLEGDFMVLADEGKAKEVFENLIGNAIKYNRVGGSVEIKLYNSNEGVVEIEVRDDGFGIPEDQQDKIFGKFFRATSKDTQGIMGTGLGLFITKMLVEKMSGDIKFTSVEGKGSCFLVSFKAVKVS